MVRPAAVGFLRGLPRGARRVAFAWMALVLVLGVLRSGGRFFYCEAMQTLSAAPCCQKAHHGSPDGARVESPVEGCCKAGANAALPLGALPEVGSPLAAPLVAILQPPAPALHVAADGVARAVRSRHTGPPAPSSRSLRTRLMVFTI